MPGDSPTDLRRINCPAMYCPAAGIENREEQACSTSGMIKLLLREELAGYIYHNSKDSIALAYSPVQKTFHRLIFNTSHSVCQRRSQTIVVFLVFSLLVACTTSPLGRKQLAFFPSDELKQMGEMSYANLKKQTPVDHDPAINRYVDCIVSHISRVLDDSTSKWNVTVFNENQANAFALPGGNIGVYKGLLAVAKTQSQLAAVIGHEIAHVLAGHANERLSTATTAQAGLTLLSAALNNDTKSQQLIMGVLGVGVQVGVLLPYSRVQEKEADLLGLDLMAKAGFDPRQAVALWHNMSKAGGKAPPEFLSTHPSSSSRIKALQERMPHALNLYQQAQSGQRHPQCR